MAQITYADKSAMNSNSNIPATNKCQASDMNEIKSVVNTNYNEIIDKITPVALYNNTSGSNGTIALSDSSANYEYIEIFYRSNDNDYSSVKVYQPNGKNVSLFAARPNGSTTRVYQKYRVVNINGTSISTITNGAVQFTAIQSSGCVVVAETDIYITRVIGFK